MNTISTVKRFFLIFGVFIIVIVQLCCCEPNSPRMSNNNYAQLMGFRSVTCSGRKYMPETIAKDMQKVCKEYFNGNKPATKNKNRSWTKSLKILPEKELPLRRVFRPYYLITPSDYQPQSDKLISGKTP